ncbi:MAG: DEAD/DEAH box helicase, partial [Oscillospiraceae bacterium]
TRELALQIYENFVNYSKHTKLSCCVVFGGVSQRPQEADLKKGVDILIATPGRLNDLINQGIISLSAIQMFILDEADRMLDMGFIHDIRKIIAKIPQERQTLLFSATMPKAIADMAHSLLTNPQRVDVAPVSSTVDTIRQKVYFVDKDNKKDLLLSILKDNTIDNTLVFTRTKYGADKITRFLEKSGINAQAIHGDKSQGARQLALSNFKEGKTRVLVATDIAARGIDIDSLSYVINFELPNIAETYVHRIGRTGRAGQSGIALSLCDFDEKEYLDDIEKLIGKEIEVVIGHDYPMVNDFPTPKELKQQRPSRGPRQSQGAKAPFASRQGTGNKRDDRRPSSSKNDRAPKFEDKKTSKPFSSQSSGEKAPSRPFGAAKSNDKKFGKNEGHSQRPVSPRTDTRKGKIDGKPQPSFLKYSSAAIKSKDGKPSK